MVSIFYIKMGVVYMLAFENLYYIGSTIQKLNERINEHKSRYKRWLNKKTHYCSSYEIIKNKDYNVIMIEEVKNETKEECREREQFWINFYGIKNLINNNNANGLDNERSKEKLKEYYDINKEKIKEYYEINKEKISQQKKEYHKINKEKISQQKKEYYLKKKLLDIII